MVLPDGYVWSFLVYKPIKIGEKKKKDYNCHIVYIKICLVQEGLCPKMQTFTK